MLSKCSAKVFSSAKTLHHCSKRCMSIVPMVPTKPVANWIFGLAGFVGGIVAVGGITRLTRSGLSMTSWKLTGSLPPMNNEEWMIEFNRYKEFPEYQQRKNMTLEEFKSIYYWEYGHRMLGRVLGVAFAVPFVYFQYKNMIPRGYTARLLGIFSLGGMQGLVGWWMVRSGLEESRRGDTKEIRVAPYRLAVHLGMAFTTYSLLLWTALDLYRGKALQDLTAQCVNSVQRLKNLRLFSIVNLGLVGITAFSGAFVAGNDAGRAYNTFPKMGEEWIPSDIFALQPVYRNCIENTATVQFNHRTLALSTLASISGMFYFAKRSCFDVLPKFSRQALHSMIGMSYVQVALGISTLLLYVPIPLAVAHQAGSLALLTFSIFTVHSMKFTKHLKVAADVASRIRS